MIRTRFRLPLLAALLCLAVTAWAATASLFTDATVDYGEPTKYRTDIDLNGGSVSLLAAKTPYADLAMLAYASAATVKTESNDTQTKATVTYGKVTLRDFRGYPATPVKTYPGTLVVEVDELAKNIGWKAWRSTDPQAGPPWQQSHDAGGAYALLAANGVIVVK